MKIDMLEVKKDRVKEIDKQIRIIKSKRWSAESILQAEKKTLLQEIKDIEIKRGELHERKALL